MKPAPDIQKQLVSYVMAYLTGIEALRLYAAGERGNALPFHRAAKFYEAIWRAYGGQGRIRLQLGADRLL